MTIGQKKRSDLLDAMSEKILILDGAMGTMLQRIGLGEGNDMLNLTRPEAIADIHRQYIEAGADIIESNTFSSNIITQSGFGHADKAVQMALEGARIARRAADAASRKVFVAGSVGPTGKSLSLASDLCDMGFREYSFDDMAAAYRSQIEALIDGGADIILFETCFDALNVKAGIYALRTLERERPELAGFPVMVSMTVGDRSGRCLTGQTMEAFHTSVRHAGLISFGLNCSLGAEDMEPLIAEISEWADCPVSCYPNAGLPDENGDYSQTPQIMAAHMSRIASHGLNIAGGCCGTTPEHIRAIAEALHGMPPRQLPAECGHLRVSGLEIVHVHDAHKIRYSSIIASDDPDATLEDAAALIDSGADMIEIKTDGTLPDSAASMRTLMRHLSNDPTVSCAAIMIDSADWETIAEGLRNAQGKCIVNSTHADGSEEETLRKAREIANLGAAVMATESTRRIFMEAGIPASEVINFER